MNQISEQYYWAGEGKPIVITSLANAIAAIEIIIVQGEGSSDTYFKGDQAFFNKDYKLPHFFRFKEIAIGRYYQQGDNLREAPRGEKFSVDYTETYPLKINAKSSDYAEGTNLRHLNNTFNLNYSIMLYQLQEGFNGTPSLFYTAIMNGMHNLSSIAMEMVVLPIKNDPEQRNGCPTFEWIIPPSF